MDKVLVTGATGFIGNYVVDDLLRHGIPVVATSSLRSRAEQMPWFAKVEYVEFNFNNFEVEKNYFDFFSRPGRVIHLAWQGLPNYTSLFHFEKNLPLHYAFLKNIIGGGCKNLTVTGTCFEYGMAEGMLSEAMPANPSNPYGLAKDALRRFLQELQKTADFEYKWLRLFYLSGKGQNPKSLFSQLETALNNNDDVFNMSGGEQVRDYLSVEVAAGYIVRTAMQDEVAGIINCCSGQPVTVKQMVDEYIKLKNKSIHLNLGHYPYPDYEPMAFWGDNKKLQQIIHEH